jgi:DNA-directed RNA polymerase specialized sigma24 family protein
LSKGPKSQWRKRCRQLGAVLNFSALVIRICFEFRYSNFEFDSRPELLVDTRGEAHDKEPVFVLDGRMCEVAGAINGLGQFERELLVLHHIEGIEVVTLADAHGMSAEEIRRALAQAEGQFIELLCGLSSWDEGIKPDVHTLPVAFADCIDLPWANSLAVYALRYVAQWPE